MQDLEDVAVFWDFDGTRPSNISGYDIAKNIRITGQIFGIVKSFRCYYDFSALNSLQTLSLRPELQASGVSLIDCPSTTVASKMMLVDLITHALDHPSPTTFLIITGDKDFSYAIAILRMRKYRVVLLSPPGTHSNLKSQASVNVDWNKAVLELGDEDDITVNPDVPPPVAQTQRSRSRSFAPPLVPEHRDSSEDPINIEARNRSRRNSLFSKPLYDPNRFNIFGDPYNPPKLPNLSDGFSRPHWQSHLRADSAPPTASYVNGGMSTHETGYFRTPEGMGRHTPPDPLASYSAWAEKGKGKQREFPFPEPDDLTPFAQTAVPAFRRSSLNHSDTDVAGREQVHPLRHSPLASVRQSSPYRGQAHVSPRSVKTLSSSSSGSSGFSMVGPPTSTGLTSTEPATQEKENKVFASTTSAVAPAYTPPAQSDSMVAQQESTPQPATTPLPSTTAAAVDGTATPATVATTAIPVTSTTLPVTAPTTAPPATTASWHIPGKPAVVSSTSKPSSSSPKIPPAMPSAVPSTAPSAGPSTNAQPASSKPPVPQQFRTLVERIRSYGSQALIDGVTRTALGAELLRVDQNIYMKANVSKFAAYIEAARVAGVVTVGTNKKGEGVVFLRSPWPYVD